MGYIPGQMQIQGIDGRFNAAVMEDDNGSEYIQVTIAGDTLTDYARITWLYQYCEIYLEALRQVSSLTPLLHTSYISI